MFTPFWWHTYFLLYLYPYNMGIIASNSCDHSKSEEPLGLKLLMKVFLSTNKLLWSVFVLKIAGHTLIIVQYASFKYKNKFSGKNLISQSVPELTLTDKFKFSRYLYSDQSPLPNCLLGLTFTETVLPPQFVLLLTKKCVLTHCISMLQNIYMLCAEEITARETNLTWPNSQGAIQSVARVSKCFHHL